MRQHLNVTILALAVILAGIVLLARVPVQAAAPDPAPAPHTEATPASLYPSPNDRIGVGLVYAIGDITSYDVAQLEAGWFADWFSRLSPPHPNGIDYVPVIAVDGANYPPNWDAIAARAQRNPGSLWLIGNEQEATYQGNLTPAQYAQIYHDSYYQVKAADPTAKVAVGGVILPSPLRLQWLDRTLAEYQTRYGEPMPVDVWNTHMQIVNEVSCLYDPGNCWGAEIPAGLTATTGITMVLTDNANFDLFVRLLRDMRTWMNDRGFRDKALIISEYGVLLPSTYICDCGDETVGNAIVASFMTRTFEYMLNTVDANLGYPADGNRLVQRWMWYTLNDQPYNFDTGEGFNGGLFNWKDNVFPGTLTYFGQVFKSFVPPLKVLYRDLFPTELTSTAQGGGQYALAVTVRNSGNTAASNVKVRLYAGNPAAGGVQVGSDATIPSLGIRYSTPGVAVFTWSRAPEVVQQIFYVVVDPDNAISESDEINNRASYNIRYMTYTYHIMLPVILKNLP